MVQKSSEKTTFNYQSSTGEFSLEFPGCHPGINPRCIHPPLGSGLNAGSGLQAFQAVPEDLFLKGEVQDGWTAAKLRVPIFTTGFAFLLGENGGEMGWKVNGLNGFAWGYKPLRLDLFVF